MLEEDSKVNVYRLCVVLKGQKRKKRFARQWNSRGLHHQGEMVALGVVHGYRLCVVPQGPGLWES